MPTLPSHPVIELADPMLLSIINCTQLLYLRVVSFGPRRLHGNFSSIFHIIVLYMSAELTSHLFMFCGIFAEFG